MQTRTLPSIRVHRVSAYKRVRYCFCFTNIPYSVFRIRFSTIIHTMEAQVIVYVLVANLVTTDDKKYFLVDHSSSSQDKRSVLDMDLVSYEIQLLFPLENNLLFVEVHSFQLTRLSRTLNPGFATGLSQKQLRHYDMRKVAYCSTDLQSRIRDPLFENDFLLQQKMHQQCS